MKRIIASLLLVLSLSFAGSLIFQPSFSLAQEGILPEEHGGGECPDGYTGSNCGNYSLDDFLSLAVKVSDWVLGFVGSAALLFFVYGGLLFVMSGGSSEKVDQGKRMIFGSITGLVLVFASFLIIQFVMSSLGFVKSEKGAWSKSTNSIKWEDSVK
jgi:hypothetical protein